MEAKKSAKQVSISDIAEALGLTASTISRALNGNPRISEATRERVVEQARRMNYNYNGAAASLRGLTNSKSLTRRRCWLSTTPTPG